ncbi:sensor histidine kinase [Chryseotalea sanaruensis]|uniref:histidine kinase n=1 Tax=Chryseotalea sanaruensis TaxID=2482724 RepID=A0A401UD03_9BACT|nr:ATP-binding protein [Chryseotalea sanaruensis]GCC52785.1 sensor histidine kinase [Chryseotalea sanaruensis]
MRTQTKIAVIFFLISLATIIILSASVYYFIIQYSSTDFYKRLEIRGFITAKSYLDQEEASQAVLQEVRKMHLEELPEEREYFLKMEEGKGFEQEAAELFIPLEFFDKVIEVGKATYRKDNTFYAGIQYQGKTGKYIVIVSADNYYNIQLLSYLRNIFTISIFIVSLFALFIALIFSKQIFNPVKQIINRVNEISSQSLHLRLKTARANDEISELERTFNNMLDRLETSFETQNNFISNASHELSTPLTTIIGEADVTLTRERTKQEYIDSLTIIQKEAERLEKITKSLLFLAQTGLTDKIQKFEITRIDQLLWDVKSTIDKINPGNKVQLNLSLMPDNPEQLQINCNQQLLHLAISNLINNSCKYSNNQVVTVTVGTTDNNVVILIKDMGIGIPEEDLKYIYDPFFRASNAREYAGYGIGLPLTRNIVRLHKGEIQLNSKINEGTTVQISLPTITSATD